MAWSLRKNAHTLSKRPRGRVPTQNATAFCVGSGGGPGKTKPLSLWDKHCSSAGRERGLGEGCSDTGKEKYKVRRYTPSPTRPKFLSHPSPTPGVAHATPHLPRTAHPARRHPAHRRLQRRTRRRHCRRPRPGRARPMPLARHLPPDRHPQKPPRRTEPRRARTHHRQPARTRHPQNRRTRRIQPAGIQPWRATPGRKSATPRHRGDGHQPLPAPLCPLAGSRNPCRTGRWRACHVPEQRLRRPVRWQRAPAGHQPARLCLAQRRRTALHLRLRHLRRRARRNRTAPPGRQTAAGRLGH